MKSMTTVSSLTLCVAACLATSPLLLASSSEGGTAAVDEGRPVQARPAERGLDAEELAIWNDPTFKRRFAESYMAETEVEPRITVVERDQMREVLELISADKMGKALNLLRKQGGPASSAVFDFTVANIHFQRDEFDQAVRAYGVAVDKFPRFRRAWRNLGLIHLRRNEFAEAADGLTRVISLGGGDSITYGLLGFAYSNLEDHLAAETAYRMASLLDPASKEWKMHLARSFFKQKRYADAAALCEHLIGQEPDRADLWLLQANAFIGQEQPLRAAENFELVDRLGGSTVESLNMLGDIYINEELYGLAVDSYARALALDAAAPLERPIRAARILAAQGALAETALLIERIEAQRGAELAEGYRKDLLKLRARLAVAAGAAEEEVRILEAIVELDPLDGEALILLGQAAGRSGDVEQAIFYYERAASLEEHEADAKVRHAQLLAGERRYAEALVLLRRAQKLRPRQNIQEYLEQVERAAKR